MANAVCKNYFVFLTPSVVGGLYELVEEIQLFREIWGVPVGQAGGGQGGRKGQDGEGDKGAHRGGFECELVWKTGCNA